MNIITSIVGQLVIIVCGIIVPRLMIGAFGTEAYGATASIAQFLAYITLLDGGVGGVARTVLYKPLADKDYKKISLIMGEIKRFFTVVAWIFSVYVLILAVSFKTISGLEVMNFTSTVLLVLAISVSTFGQYFVGLSNYVFLKADQKIYIYNTLSAVVTLLNALGVSVLIYFDCNIIIVKLASSFIFLIRPLIMALYVKKNYPLIKDKGVKGSVYLKDKWVGLGQHIAFFLHSNTDIAILTLCADLRAVAVYSVYNMVISHIQSLAISFSSGMEAVFGDMLVRGEQKKLHDTFSAFETVLSLVSLVLFSTTAVLIVPFIKLYTAGVMDANYIEPLFAIVMILASLTFCLRLPYNSVVIAAGHFKETSIAAYGEAIINIVLSMLLVFRYNLTGVAIATLFATWFRFIYYVIYLRKNIFKRPIKLFIKRFAVNAGTFLCNYFIGGAIISGIIVNDYFWWAVCGVLSASAIGVFTLAVNFIFFRKDCCLLLKKVINKNAL